jgi:hypothetical protein
MTLRRLRSRRFSIALNATASSTTMETLIRSTAFILWSLLACFVSMPVSKAGTRPVVIEYHGWHVDITRVADSKDREQIIEAIQQQLEWVEKAGLKIEIVGFMRSIPIWANPARKKFGAAHYSRATGVDFHARQLDGCKPIFLHELLHAYQDQRLGASAGTIQRFYENALRSGKWPPTAYMLESNREFFAVTASVYLFGSIDRPPFARTNLEAADPDYYAWLAHLVSDPSNDRDVAARKVGCIPEGHPVELSE